MAGTDGEFGGVNYTKLSKYKTKLDQCDPDIFLGVNSGFPHFTLNLSIVAFRHLKDIELKFEHPITLISGTNRIGKTSMLLLLACSHEKFLKLDSSKPEPTLREHAWKDVIAFTKYENQGIDYEYKLSWRVGVKTNTGTGKRLASTRSWSGLGKKARDRINAKIRDREVRLVDLDRLLPARSFSGSLLRKTGYTLPIPLDKDVIDAFCYVLDIPDRENFQISEISGHVNKRCYAIGNGTETYSSYGAASGEESLINLLREVIECPKNSLILIDELEAGFHPKIQRKLAEVLTMISWEHKKQMIITTHSATLIDSFPAKSRKFIEKRGADFEVISGLSPQAAISKMDSVGHPLIHLYCEDDLAEFLITAVMIEINKEKPSFSKLINVIRSGPANSVKVDFERHCHRYPQVVNKHGFAAIIDGDMKANNHFKDLLDNENVLFLYPEKAPEKFLIQAYLYINDNDELATFTQYNNSHGAFDKMVDLGLATSKEDARSKCFEAFKLNAVEFEKFSSPLLNFLEGVITRFSDPTYDPLN